MSVIGYNVFGVETTQVEAGPNIINKIMGSGAYEGQKRYSVRYSSPKGTLTGRQEASLSAAVNEAKSILVQTLWKAMFIGHATTSSHI